MRKMTDKEEQLEVMLAGCLTAAEGWEGKRPIKKGAWAWSPALQAVRELRRRYDDLRKKTVDRVA
jgi:hypothetical protein